MLQARGFPKALSVRLGAGAWVFALGVCVSPHVSAQKKLPVDEVAVTSSIDPCKKEVLKFEETMAFLRQTQGNQAAEDLKKKLMPPDVESRILATEGYCGLAKYIRDKKLNR